MSQTTVAFQISHTPRQLDGRALILVIAMASFSSLLLELAMTRLFSVVLFYHFAFFAISVALLGLGSGGVIAQLRRPWLQRFDTRSLGSWLCLGNSLLIFIALLVV